MNKSEEQHEMEAGCMWGGGGLVRVRKRPCKENKSVFLERGERWFLFFLYFLSRRIHEAIECDSKVGEEVVEKTAPHKLRGASETKNHSPLPDKGTA